MSAPEFDPDLAIVFHAAAPLANGEIPIEATVIGNPARPDAIPAAALVGVLRQIADTIEADNG